MEVCSQIRLFWRERSVQPAVVRSSHNDEGHWSVVPQTVASTLGGRELPGRPLIDGLAQAIATRQLLLLLDNCEHVLSACAGLVYSLLQACPQHSVLTTTREPLNIAGEMVW